MNDLLVSRRTRPVAVWLLAGVFMIMVQVVLGGITRLTGSGLSITDWNPIMGAIPPLNHQEWMTAFSRYQQTPQYHLVNSDFSLHDFKSIFFWEYFHRLWARLLGVVFLVPFVIFLLQKRFSRSMVNPMIILFLLGALQGAIGWLMVESGLIGDNVRVNHIKLAIHFITAMLLLCYTLWFALKLLVKEEQQTARRPLKKFTIAIIVILTLQLVYGAFMAGMHAELAAPTWPAINGMAIPDTLFKDQPWWINFYGNKIMVQFIHRGLAYLLTLLIFIWWLRSRSLPGTHLFRRIRVWPLLIVLLQATLGVLTLLHSTIRIPVTLAILHQFVAMILLSAMMIALYILSKNVSPSPPRESPGRSR